MRLQIVVAHPDDETFGCGSLLLFARAAGVITAVCCATRGEAGEALDGVDLATTREAELRTAAEHLGVSQVDLLDFRDSGMSGDADTTTVAGAPPAAIRAAVQRCIESFGPDVVVTLDAGDGHRDHVVMRDAAVAVADAVGVPRVYLMCLPRSLMRRWLEHIAVIRPETQHLEPEIAALGTPDEDITTVLDVREHLPELERAIAMHASQTSPYEGLPRDLYEAFLGNAHLRRVRPPSASDRTEASPFV